VRERVVMQPPTRRWPWRLSRHRTVTVVVAEVPVTTTWLRCRRFANRHSSSSPVSKPSLASTTVSR